MSQYISGSSSKIGAVKETVFDQQYSPISGRPASTALRMTSESLSSTYNRLDEGILMASKTAPQQDLGSVGVSGGINVVLNPSFIDWILEAGLGVKENTTPSNQPESGATLAEYTYTLADPDADIPSSALELWRGNEGFFYTGMTVSTLSIDATAQDFVKADISFNGTRENWISANPSDSKVGPSTNLGSYKCTKARLYNNTADCDEVSDFTNLGWDDSSCPANTVYDVEKAVLSIDNGLETTPATYCSGLYANQPTHGQRTVSLTCNVPYSTGFETFRQSYYANENAAPLALMLCFGSKEQITYVPYGEVDSVTEPAHQVLVVLPNVQITSASANASGAGLIDGSYVGTALSIGTTEPIKVVVRTYTAIS